MFKIGQKVKRKLSLQVMEVIDLQPQFVENVITQWEDANGSIKTGKFIEHSLELVRVFND
jgi:hypothetical protein